MTIVTVLRGAILAFAVAACASPPSRTPTVLLVPGKSIEVVGLQRWTIAMMQDSLAKYAPGTTLDSHACAAALRYQLGFADAAATSYELPGDSLERVVVIVVEPQDSARVRHRVAPLDTLAPRHEWAPVIRVLSEQPGPFQMSLWRYRAWRGGDSTALRGLSGADSIAVLGVWRFLAARESRADKGPLWVPCTRIRTFAIEWLRWHCCRTSRTTIACRTLSCARSWRRMVPSAQWRVSSCPRSRRRHHARWTGVPSLLNYTRCSEAPHCSTSPARCACWLPRGSTRALLCPCCGMEVRCFSRSRQQSTPISGIRRTGSWSLFGERISVTMPRCGRAGCVGSRRSRPRST
jgi:hypothetical protein